MDQYRRSGSCARSGSRLAVPATATRETVMRRGGRQCGLVPDGVDSRAVAGLSRSSAWRCARSFRSPPARRAGPTVSAASVQAATTPPSSSVIKTIDPARLQATVDAAAKELMIPGAVVEVRTPQGPSRRRRARRDGRRAAPGGRHPLPDRLDHQDDDLRGDRAAGPRRQAAVRRSDIEVRSGRAEWREHHHLGATEDAQRPVRLYERSRVRGCSRCEPGEGLDAAGGVGHRVSGIRRSSRPAPRTTTATPTTPCWAW